MPQEYIYSTWLLFTDILTLWPNQIFAKWEKYCTKDYIKDFFKHKPLFQDF